MRRRCASVLVAVAAIAACQAPELSEPAVARAREAAGAVDAALLEAHVRAIADARRGDVATEVPWLEGRPHYRLATAAYFVAQVEALGLSVVQEPSNTGGLEANNLVVDFPGVALASEIVLVGAHYDSWWVGANDNATGVAALLEAARVLSSLPPPRRTVRLVAFDQEETGAVGSSRYAEAHRDDVVSVAFNVDMIGYASDAPDSQDVPFGLYLPTVANFVLLVANAPAEIPATRLARLSTLLPNPVRVEGLLLPGDGAVPLFTGFQGSDHSPFWDRGIPLLSLSDGGPTRNAAYHTADDTEDTIDYAFLHRVAQLTIGAVFAFAEAD